MKPIQSTIVMSVLALLGCSAAPQEPGPAAFDLYATHVESATAPVAQVAGYVHHLTASHFSVGPAIRELDEFGMHKIVGNDGTFATLPSGLTIATANSDAQSRGRGRLPGDAAAHNGAVRAYFVGAGIPENQIDAVRDFEVVGAGGHGAPTGNVVGVLQYRNSMITRQISGVPVPDSFAWAHLNEDGNVVEESVYWPPIPTSVAQQAAALSARLSVSTEIANYRKTIGVSAEGRVCIRHSPGEWRQGFVVAAVYDVVGSTTLGMPRTLHFDDTAAPTALPFEAPDAWGPSLAMTVKTK